MAVFQPLVLFHWYSTHDKAGCNHHLNIVKALDHDQDGNLHLLHNGCAPNDEVPTGRDSLVAESDAGLACAKIK